MKGECATKTDYYSPRLVGNKLESAGPYKDDPSALRQGSAMRILMVYGKSIFQNQESDP